MVSAEYMVAYSEVLEILKYIPKRDYDKIPQDMINVFNKNAYKNSKFEYDPSKTLQEQNVSQTAKTIIALLFRDYWATEEQKNKILNFQKKERQNYANVNNVFKNRNYKQVQEVEKKQQTQQDDYKAYLPSVIEKENIFKRIIQFIKNIFSKKR